VTDLVRFSAKCAVSAVPNPKENTMTTKVADSAVRAPLEPLLTVEDLERLLRVDKRTVARLCKRGQLPQPLKIGGGNRWRPEEIPAAIDRLSRRAGRKIEPAGEEERGQAC
jgi:predicted DNA-binding transcriptional regulator AlpA